MSAEHAPGADAHQVSPAPPPCTTVYRDAVATEAVRVLGLMDRETDSPTRGCMDRTYWAWKFTDFPGVRFQEGLCSLSFLYSHDFPGNRYHQQAKLRKWIAHGFDYWSRIQYRDGSFDEAYPFERSLAATAFSAFYLSEAWLLLDGRLPKAVGERFRLTLAKAGNWLLKNDETHGFLSNHLAAASTALQHAYRILGEDRFEKRSRYFLNKILDHQSDEGWYDEYGGADPGYQTHGSFYLARQWEFTGDEELLASLGRSLAFLAHFVHPDGSLGGEYASRNTQTYYPAAFEMLSGVNGSARWIAERMQPAAGNLAAAGLGSVDAYNYFPLMNNYVFAHLATLKQDHRACPTTPPTEESTHFPQAGLVKARTKRLTVYVGLHKGGVLKVFDHDRGRLLGNDCGYIGRLRNGKFLSSQALDKHRPTDVGPHQIVVQGNFYQIKRPVMRPLSFLGFRVFMLTIGRSAAVARWLKSLLVKTLIYRKQALDLRLVRTITLHDDRCTVRDHLQGSAGPRVASLAWRSLFTTIHMGSSRYFVPHELNDAPEPEGADEFTANPAQLAQGVTVERTFSTG